MRDSNLSEPESCLATARGIVHCLRMLAEEANSLGLIYTVHALWSAIGVCEREASVPPMPSPNEAGQRFIAPLH